MTFKDLLFEQRRDLSQSSPFWRFCAKLTSGRVVCPLVNPDIFERLEGPGTPSKLFLDDFRNRKAMNQIENLGVLDPSGKTITWARTSFAPLLDAQFRIRKVYEMQGKVNSEGGAVQAESSKLLSEYTAIELIYQDIVILTKIDDKSGCQVEARTYYIPEMFEWADAESNRDMLRSQVDTMSADIKKAISLRDSLSYKLGFLEVQMEWTPVLVRLRKRLQQFLQRIPLVCSQEEKMLKIAAGNLNSTLASLLVEAGYGGEIMEEMTEDETWVERTSKLVKEAESFLKDKAA